MTVYRAGKFELWAEVAEICEAGYPEGVSDTEWGWVWWAVSWLKAGPHVHRVGLPQI